MQRKRPHDTLGAFGGVARASELYPDWRIGYAPAYPALGSTVKDGALYVTALRSSIGHFAQDRLNPIRGDVGRSVQFAWLCPALKEQTQPHAGVNQLEHERFRRALATRSFS